MKDTCHGWFRVHHNYGRWEIISEGQIVDVDDSTIIKGNYIRQQRVCIDCHFIQQTYDELGTGVHRHQITKEV